MRIKKTQVYRFPEKHFVQRKTRVKTRQKLKYEKTLIDVDLKIRKAAELCLTFGPMVQGRKWLGYSFWSLQDPITRGIYLPNFKTICYSMFYSGMRMFMIFQQERKNYYIHKLLLDMYFWKKI
jgi:hypothetical protein